MLMIHEGTACDWGQCWLLQEQDLGWTPLQQPWLELQSSIYEDYAPEVVEQRQKYREVMSELYNLGFKPALLFPARLVNMMKDGALDGPGVNWQTASLVVLSV
ncbi:unnamed protein product [Merluccius merluccius]